MRVALYARVSTEEQARHGISIDAQMSALRIWAQEQGHEVVGEFIDNGISARKSPSKRPALQSLLAQIQNSQTELVAFTKLDRWTRNVKGYYQVQEVLDRHRVAWIAIQEDYETITASGRFKVNIMLSVAENEADRTSERIKTVFEHKVAQGEPISRSQPLGFSIQGKRLVHNEQAHIAREAFELYSRLGNKFAVRDMLDREYGFHTSLVTVDRMLRNTLYIGEYRGNKQFCEPIVPVDLFDRVQRDLAARSTRRPPSGRVYLFSGLVICKDCGRRFSSCFKNKRVYYRCHSGHQMYKDCQNKFNAKESDIEEVALNALCGLVKGARVEYRPTQKKKQTASRDAVRRKLDRLTELYVDGDISKDDYTARRDALNRQLEEPAPKPSQIHTLDGDNFLTDYAQMTKEQKKAFWRSVIERIEIGKDETVDIFFDL